MKNENKMFTYDKVLMQQAEKYISSCAYQYNM